MINPVLLEVFKHKFSSIAEQMGVTLQRTAYSPNIKERRDFSCALFNHRGELIAQAAHIPVHLGSMPLSVESAVRSVVMSPGDMAALNDPFQGGTHLPDITLVAPVFADETSPAFYVANRAHHSDIGGMSPGSMPLAVSIFQEGVLIPPIRLVENGQWESNALKLLLRNVRTPAEREGDFAAQRMANLIGIRELLELVKTHGAETVRSYARGLLDYAEQRMRETIGKVPDGRYSFEDFMEDDGIDGSNIPIRVTVEVRGSRAVLDFTRSSPQVTGSINAVRAITVSAVLYVFRSLMEEEVPANAGCLRPIEILTTPGSIVDASFPCAVAGGNVETSQRIVDVILGALAQALPELIPAASQGTMNNVSIGGMDERTGRPFAYYETLGGGMGASMAGPGESAVHSHMTNTLNTPVEALEYAYPMLVREYSIRRGSGGKGKHAGGDGLVRELRLLSDAEVTLLSERRRRVPYGLEGGQSGASGRNTVRRGGRTEERPGKFSERLSKGDVLRIETPGGGGWGGKS